MLIKIFDILLNLETHHFLLILNKVILSTLIETNLGGFWELPVPEVVLKISSLGFGGNFFNFEVEDWPPSASGKDKGATGPGTKPEAGIFKRIDSIQ